MTEILKKSEEIFKCQGCIFSTNLSQDMIIHIQINHDSSFEPFKCAICDFKSLWEAPLYRHVELEHSKKPKFSCDFCVFITDDQEALDEHIKYLHPIEEEIFKCETGVDRLMKIKCEICSKEYSTRFGLKKHILTKHKDTAALLEKCENCDFATPYSDALAKHKLSVHHSDDNKSLI